MADRAKPVSCFGQTRLQQVAGLGLWPSGVASVGECFLACSEERGRRLVPRRSGVRRAAD
jgi:hypothetical protein